MFSLINPYSSAQIGIFIVHVIQSDFSGVTFLCYITSKAHRLISLLLFSPYRTFLLRWATLTTPNPAAAHLSLAQWYEGSFSMDFPKSNLISFLDKIFKIISWHFISSFSTGSYGCSWSSWIPWLLCKCSFISSDDHFDNILPNIALSLGIILAYY